MHQNDINKDLGQYLHERKKSDSVWNKVFGAKPRPKEEVQEDIKVDLEKAEQKENLAPEDKQELEKMEEKIEEVNKVEGDVEGQIEQEHEGLLKRFFKKLRGSKSETSQEEEEHEESEDSEEEQKENGHELSREEMRDFLKINHQWITQLPPEKLQEFKHSKDFELYTKVLKEYNLIK